MAILKVAKLGHPTLREVAQPVEESKILANTTQRFIDSMIETMHEYGGIGLAAPQVHTCQQICILEVNSNNSSRYPDAPTIPLTVMINPKVEVLDNNSIKSWEGCLSVPDFIAFVPRYSKISVTYFNRHGDKNTLLAEDFISVVIQHETDHLQGKIFLDRLEELSSLAYKSEFQKFSSS